MADKNTQPSSQDTIVRIHEEIDETKGIMLRNIEQVVARGERLDDIENKTYELEKDSHLFNINATKLKRAMCSRYCCLIFAILAFILVICAIIVLSVCGSLHCWGTTSTIVPTPSIPISFPPN